MRITRFEEIEAWQTARILVVTVYSLSREGELARDFGFRNQIRRASLSVMSNIAEGFGSSTRNEFIRYLGLARASASELKTNQRT